ncbi:MAG TPA: DUF3662 and FHA domain-containing protein, partial [Actinomycetota bacterium]|nr:DUF3662 and FHA domain-containing protein [Actinomycetota bacterium]
KGRMGILREFERRLERAVEGAFTKAFRSGVQPVELARRLLREMEANKTVGVREIWVPNRYRFLLSPEDHEHFAGMEHGLVKELEQVAIDGARERGFGLVAKPEIVFEEKDSYKRGRFEVEAELTEETGAPEPGEGALPGQAALVVADGDGSREFALAADIAVIGRMAGSDVEISDPGASRKHAEVRRDGEGFLLVDLGSTNGTLVNDKQVSEHRLRHGDRITIGQTELRFREA